MRRVLVLIAVVLVVAALLVGGFAVRAGLADDRDAVDEAWEPVAEAMSPRADAIGLLAEAIGEASLTSGTSREVVDEANAEVALWWKAVDDEPTGVQVAIANNLEGFAARLASTVTGSSVLSNNEFVAAALVRLRESVIPSGFVEVYNDAVTRYDDRRESFVGRPVAAVLGFDAAVAFAPVALPPPSPDEAPGEVPDDTAAEEPAGA